LIAAFRAFDTPNERFSRRPDFRGPARKSRKTSARAAIGRRFIPRLICQSQHLEINPPPASRSSKQDANSPTRFRSAARESPPNLHFRLDFREIGLVPPFPRLPPKFARLAARPLNVLPPKSPCSTNSVRYTGIGSQAASPGAFYIYRGRRKIPKTFLLQ
jgi:hypothetical protein